MQTHRSSLHNNSALKNELIVLSGAEESIINTLNDILYKQGFLNIKIVREQNLLSFLNENVASLIVFAYKKAEVSGYLKSIMNEKSENLPVIIVAEQTNTDSIIKLIKMGVFDVIVMSDMVDDTRFELSTIRAIERKLLTDALNFATKSAFEIKIKFPHAFANIVTQSESIKIIFHYMEQVAKSSFPVLITGETGVGKELFAQAIHYLSGLNPYVPVNIAGIDDSVFSDTLFGHKKGSYTGADVERKGIIAKADGGVLFLDEIGELSEMSQVKLLRLLQDNSYYQLGSDEKSEANCKIVMATNRNLAEEVEKGRFRKDLYYRIKAHNIFIPPLRDRKEDISLLTAHFTAKTAKSLNIEPPKISPELIERLYKYNWPGNVRELEALVADAVIRGDRHYLEIVIPDENSQSRRQSDKSNKNFLTLKECEEEHVNKALAIAGGNQSAAAKMLGISRQALNKRLKK